MTYDEINKKFKAEKEFFVGNNFATNNNFNHLHTYAFSNDMLYANNESYFLQDRKTENRIEEEIKITEPQSNFKERTSAFPLCSDKFVLKLINSSIDGGDGNNGAELYLSPPLNSQKAVNNASFYYNDIEYFSHCDPTKLVRMKKLFMDDEDDPNISKNNKILVGFALINGLSIEDRSYKLPSDSNTNEIIEIMVSKSGEYFSLATLVISDNQDDEKKVKVYNYKIIDQRGAPIDVYNDDMSEDNYEEQPLTGQKGGQVNLSDIHLNTDLINFNKTLEITQLESIEYSIGREDKAFISYGKWKLTDKGKILYINLKMGLFFVNYDNQFGAIHGKLSKYLGSKQELEEIKREHICIGDNYLIIVIGNKIV